MQHLQEKWLRRINYYYVIFSFFFVGAYAYFTFTEQSIRVIDSHTLGSSFVAAIFGLACIVYNIFFLRFVRKYNIILAYMLSLAFFAVANNVAIEVSLHTAGSLVFLLNNYIIVLATTAMGPILSIAAIGLVLIIYGMEVAGTTVPTRLGLVGDTISLIIRVFLVGILVFIFRDHYVSDDSDSNKNYIEHYFVNNEVVKLLTDSISDAVIIIDQAGVIKSMNPGIAKMLGRDRKDMLDLDYRSVLKFQSLQHKDLDETTEPIATTLKQTKPSIQEFILILHDQSEIFVDINVSPIVNQQKNVLYGAVIILRDVTEKKKEEEARTEFISTASHEMRTPVAAIEGYIALALNQNVSKIDEKARLYLNKAHESTQHLGMLFQDLLLSAKAEDGRLVSHPTVIELGQFIEDLTDDLRIITTKKGLGLEFIMGSSDAAGQKANTKVIRPLYYCYADQDRLREVITNLFDNAVKYTGAGKITIGLTGNDDVVQFFVKDTGSGIPIEDVPHLFQKFYRVDNSATRTTGGTGLGLFISRKILELYRGRIWVESEQGKGSTFFVNLPRMGAMKAATLKDQQTSTEPVTTQTTTPAQ